MQNEPKNTIIDVIPLTRLPLNRQQHFSYLYSEEIPFGTLVSIPLFHREVKGIVINNRDDFFRFGHIKLKKINNIITRSLITENQLKLAEFISDYYICPLGTVLKFFVLNPSKSRIKKQESKSKKKEIKKMKLMRDQKSIIGKISKKNKFLLIAGNEGISISLELARKSLEENKQILLLVPEIPLAHQVFSIMKNYFDENSTVMFHSQLKGSELYENFRKIKSNEAKIIIGTRQAVFAPFNDLGLIIVSEEQDISYKQWDMNPRYNAKIAAEKLTKLYNAELVLWSAAPSIESYYKYKQDSFKVLSFNRDDIDIVDLRNEGWSKNGRIKKNVLISKKLKSEIEYALKYKKQAFLLVNHRGMSSFSVCDNCKEVFRCPRCERALVYDKSGIYRCLHCSYKTDIFPKCPKCKNTSFKNIGIGNQLIEKEITNLFPQAKIKLVDFESVKNKNDQEKLFEKIKDKKYDIIIGTQSSIKGWELPYLGLIGIIDADSLLNFPDFNSDERVYQTFINALDKAKNSGNGKLVIQTYNPEHPVIKSIRGIATENFYENELEKRKSLKYPPFYQIIKLTLRTQHKEKIEKESELIFKRLKTISEENSNILVFTPFVPQLSKIRDKFRKQIIMKVGGGNIPKNLKKYLESLGGDWIIDIDPISLT